MFIYLFNCIQDKCRYGSFIVTTGIKTVVGGSFGDTGHVTPDNVTAVDNVKRYYIIGILLHYRVLYYRQCFAVTLMGAVLLHYQAILLVTLLVNFGVTLSFDVALLGVTGDVQI